MRSVEVRTIVPKQEVLKAAAVAFSSRVCILIALFAAGCHKSDAPAGQQPASATDNSAAPAPEPSSATPLPPVPAPNPNVVARTENAVQANVAGEVNEFLTQQLRVFIQQQGRLPQTFAEFARARLDNVPRPPPGTKWVIDSASQEVKAVGSK
jgi:hypothetical protein